MLTYGEQFIIIPCNKTAIFITVWYNIDEVHNFAKLLHNVGNFNPKIVSKFKNRCK